MALSSVTYCWRSSRWLCHALSLPPFSSHPSPSGPCSLPFCFSLPSSLLLLEGSGFTELWDKEVQTCLTFLDPPCGNVVGSFSTKCWCMPLALTYSVFLWNADCCSISLKNLLMWEIMSLRNERTRQSQPSKSARCFLLSCVGRGLGYRTCTSGR